jgi:hypothetical protein
METVEKERPRKRTRIRLPRRRRSQVLLVVAVVALAVVVFLLLRGGGNDGPKTLGGSPAPFSIVYPSTWKPFNQAELAAFNQPPVAVLRQKDGKGILVLRVEKPFGGNLQKFALDLRKELDKRLNDFREVRTRVIKTEAGNAFFYSYIRTKRGTVHTIVVIPAGNQRSYALSSVSQPGANDVARDIGRMVTSFSLTK